MNARYLAFAAVAAGIAVLPSCTASLKLDRFHTEDAGSTIEAGTLKYQDLRFSASSMTPHKGENLEIRIVDSANVLQAKGVYNGITQTDFTIFMGFVVPTLKPPYRIDFWADHNKNGKYDGINGGINDIDHAWRRVLAEPLPGDVVRQGNVYALSFVHDTNFTDIATDLQGAKTPLTDTLLPLALQITGVGPYVGKMIETRVVDKASLRLIALHRQGEAAEPVSAKVTGVCDEQTPYIVSIYVDVNNDGKYGTGDPSWKVELLSDATGLTKSIDLAATAQTPIETGE